MPFEECSMDRPHWWNRTGGVETMAMQQRDDPPTPSSFAEATGNRHDRGDQATGGRRDKAAEEKEKAEARARAACQRQVARCRLQRCPPASRNGRGRNGRKSRAR